MHDISATGSRMPLVAALTEVALAKGPEEAKEIISKLGRFAS